MKHICIYIERERGGEREKEREKKRGRRERKKEGGKRESERESLSLTLLGNDVSFSWRIYLYKTSAASINVSLNDTYPITFI